MKKILLVFLGVATLYFVGFGVFATKAEVTTLEIKKTGNYERPVKEGNCFRQKDSTGNSILVCG